MKSTITGWGKCAPDNIMTNDDLAVFVDTSDEWIQQRTGIQERRFCHVNNSDMAAVAGQHAIACAGLTPEDIDVVIQPNSSFYISTDSIKNSIKRYIYTTKDSISITKIEDELDKNTFVEKSQVYTMVGNKLFVNVHPPTARPITQQV